MVNGIAYRLWSFGLLLGIALLAGEMSANAAEVWTCSWSQGVGPDQVQMLERFTVSPPDVIAENSGRYHIVQNDDDVLVATEVDVPNRANMMADTLIINKATGEFNLAMALPSASKPEISKGDAYGKCLKN